MAQVGLQEMRAFYLSATLLFAICLVIFGCGLKPNKQKYIFPNGFSGRYRIIPDKNVVSRLPVINGVTVVTFDQSGNLWVNPDDYEKLIYWSDNQDYSYMDGRKLGLDYKLFYDRKYANIFPRIIYESTQGIMVSDHDGMGEHSDGSYLLGYIAKNESEVKKYTDDYFLENGDKMPARITPKP